MNYLHEIIMYMYTLLHYLRNNDNMKHFDTSNLILLEYSM